MFAVRLRVKETGSFSYDRTTLLSGRSDENDGREKIEVLLLLLRSLGNGLTFFL
jgi:hypothetical protein